MAFPQIVPAACAAALLVVATTSLVLAQEPDCNNQMTQSVMNQCSAIDLAKADKRLNEIYQKILARNSKENASASNDPKSWEAALRKSQRAWVAFRDADCKGLVGLDWYGGSAAPLAVNSCLTDLTRRRIEILKSRYGDE